MKKIVCTVFSFLLIICLCGPVVAIGNDENKASKEENNDIISDVCKYYGIEWDACSTEIVANYLSENMYILEEIYASVFPESEMPFQGSYVEHQMPVYISTIEQMGVYLDFDGNNGYIILADVHNIVAWEACGDLQYLKNQDSAYYSIFEGFGYWEDGQYMPYEEDLEMARNPSNYSLTPYTGQNTAGDGDIVDTFAYIEARYGTGYNIMSGGGSRSLTNFPYYEQNDLSIYFETKEDGLEYGEGNCALSSMFVLMNYLQSSGKCSGLPSDDYPMTFSASTNDPFFETYDAMDNYRIVDPISLPVLYLNIRHMAIEDYGYEVSAFSDGNISPTIETIASYYETYIDATYSSKLNFETHIKNEITAGRPIILLLDSSTYGSHAVVANGYRIFVKQTTVLGITVSKYVYLIKINDNWTAAARYFDYTACENTVRCVTVSY